MLFIKIKLKINNNNNNKESKGLQAFLGEGFE